MRLCLIATTRQREPYYLERLFESLAQQEYRDFTLLLGDQNPPGTLDPLLSAFAGRFPVIVLPLEPCGLSEARNRLLAYAEGAEGAEGDVIALADDDCYYAPDTFARLARSLGELPDAAAVIGEGGADMSAPDKGERSVPTRVNWYSAHRNAPSWCLFIRREDALRVGPFDTDMGIGASTPWQSGEETDFLIRLLAGGKAVYRDARIRVFHDDENADAPNIPKIHGYGMGRMYLLQKHGYPLWFKLLNILYPLACFLGELPRQGFRTFCHRFAMLRGRLRGFWAVRGLFKS